jgi:hypothetical protein
MLEDVSLESVSQQWQKQSERKIVRQQTIPTFLLSSVVPKNYRYI